MIEQEDILHLYDKYIYLFYLSIYLFYLVGKPYFYELFLDGMLTKTQFPY